MENKSPRNKTISLSQDEINFYKSYITKVSNIKSKEELLDKIIHNNTLDIIDYLPENSIDLLIIDCPYNLNKTYNTTNFEILSDNDYIKWFENWFIPLLKTLKTTSSIYICSEWKTSGIIQPILNKYLKVRNRITWERDKGRGALKNYKNNSEDIFFCTTSDNYTFNVDSIKLKKRVIAPYVNSNREPKDWKTENGKNYRLTFPSNIWTDITIPYWSMEENCTHPTQKPEKLLAKLILASSNPGDVILDPFLGSGTSAVVAKKLDRRFIGIDLDEYYCLLALKRLALVETNKTIQGYENGIFLERNYNNK